MLVIGENATIRGTIVAETIVTRGKIHGNVTATSKIQLLKPAVVLGDISAPSFSMEEGAFLKDRSTWAHTRWPMSSNRRPWS